jgi:hypothetical protein
MTSMRPRHRPSGWPVNCPMRGCTRKRATTPGPLNGCRRFSRRRTAHDGVRAVQSDLGAGPSHRSGHAAALADGRPTNQALDITRRPRQRIETWCSQLGSSTPAPRQSTKSPPSGRAFASRRLLVPVDGFYEWFPTEQIGETGKPLKQPFYIHPANPDDVLTLAGIYEFWRGPRQARRRPGSRADLVHHHHDHSDRRRRPDPRPDADGRHPQTTGKPGSTRASTTSTRSAA